MRCTDIRMNSFSLPRNPYFESQRASMHAIAHIAVVSLVSWPLRGRNPLVDFVFIQTSLLFICT